jgi:hypothetical protein
VALPLARVIQVMGSVALMDSVMALQPRIHSLTPVSATGSTQQKISDMCGSQLCRDRHREADQMLITKAICLPWRPLVRHYRHVKSTRPHHFPWTRLLLSSSDWATINSWCLPSRLDAHDR